MINIIASLFISILSIVALLVVILKYHCIAGGEGLIGAAWILGTLGAPMTFLCLIVDKIGLNKSLVSQFIWVCFFYLLKYQLVAFLLYWLNRNNTVFFSKKNLIFVFIVLVVIIIGAIVMYRIIMGYWRIR
jgi:hypothetical protein